MPLSEVVGAPPVLPPLYGLLTSATDAAADGARWEHGYTFAPENCLPPEGYSMANCNIDFGAPETPGVPVEVLPFYIAAGVQCQSTGWTQADYAGRAQRTLELGQSRALEFMFHSNPDAVVTPYLADAATAVDPTGGNVPMSTVNAVAILTQALAQSRGGGRGTLHVTPQVAVTMQHARIVEKQGNRLQTVIGGHTVIVGSGYDGTGPGGAAPPADHHYIYATGPVTFRLDEIMFTPDNEGGLRQLMRDGMNKETNSVEVRAGRFATAAFDPCQHFYAIADPRAL